MNDVNGYPASAADFEAWRQAFGGEVPVIDLTDAEVVVDPLAPAAQPAAAPSALMFATDRAAAKQRAVLRHEAVFLRAGWTRTLDSQTVMYTPPAGAQPAEIAATEEEARQVRVRDGWVSEQRS
ncbi:hypothetical protein TSHO111613_24275 [Tsukamurella hominis]